MIKKILLATSIISTLIIGCHLDATYTMKGIISSIDTSAKEVFFIDETGNVFSYYSDLSDEYVGKHITAKFDHMGTESDRTDDHVIDVW
jgi:hypothetical protein